MTQNIPAHGSNIARKDINEIYKWKIDDLYADKESWQAAAQNLKAELSRFICRQRKLAGCRPKFKSRTQPF